VKLLYWLLWYSLICVPVAARDWTVMIYAQSDAILNSYVTRDLNAMTSIGSDDNVSIVVQWNRPHQEGTRRYKIERNDVKLVETNPVSPISLTDDLINFSSFAKKNYPAQHYMFIFWSHGSGILDPTWSELPFFCVASAMRGLLFDTTKQSYLKNEELHAAFSYITKHVIEKKFEIIGMDACLMAMLEVFYQIKDFTRYSVASEDIELAQGWNYIPLLKALSKKQTNAKDIAQNIVFSFGEFYQTRTNFFTQSAIDTSYIDPITSNLNLIVHQLLLCMQTTPETIKNIVYEARANCFQLSVPCYIDLHSFYTAMLAAISKSEKSPLFLELTKIIENGITLIDRAVISNVASQQFSGAKGISIYYPEDKIDPSYFKTEFAKNSLWIFFLEKISL
jgi:hypothetical protein